MLHNHHLFLIRASGVLKPLSVSLRETGTYPWIWLLTWLKQHQLLYVQPQMWESTKAPEMLFSEFPDFYRNKMIDEIFSWSGGVGTHCSTPVPHLNLKMAVGRKKKNKKKHNMKLLLLFTKIVVVMIMSFRAEKQTQLPNEKENIKTSTIWWKKNRKEKPRVESQDRQRDGITADPIHASLKWYFFAAYLNAGEE